MGRIFPVKRWFQFGVSFPLIWNCLYPLCPLITILQVCSHIAVSLAAIIPSAIYGCFCKWPLYPSEFRQLSNSRRFPLFYGLLFSLLTFACYLARYWLKFAVHCGKRFGIMLTFCRMRILSLMWKIACAVRAFICLVVDKFRIFYNQFVLRCYFLTYISYVLLCIWRFGSWLYCSVCEWLAVISLTCIFLCYW